MAAFTRSGERSRATRLTTAAAALSAMGLVAWLYSSVPRGGSPELPAQAGPRSAPRIGVAGAGFGGGPVSPCSIPLPWRVARVDSGFGLSDADAAAAVEAAAALWEEEAGRTLFVHDAAHGFPIRFIHDERQVWGEAARRARGRLRADSQRLDRWRHELDGSRQELAAAAAAYEARTRAFQDRISVHNARVRSWNEAGGAPAELVEEVSGAGDALDAERAALTERGHELEGRRLRLQESEDDLARAAEAYAQEARDLERQFPLTPVNAGSYQEFVRQDDAGGVAVSREIRIFRFSGRNDLVRVLAHELGHALGLDHSAETGALMSARYDERRELDAPPRVHPSDAALLRARCPEL